ncbi:hypothetical protein FOL46_002880, partial [Perkinsus olseni]
LLSASKDDRPSSSLEEGILPSSSASGDVSPVAGMEEGTKGGVVETTHRVSVPGKSSSSSESSPVVSPPSTSQTDLAVEMTKLRTMVQERFVGITSVLDRFATRQEQTNARLSYNESILNSKIDMLSSRFDKVGDTIMVQLYKSPLAKEVTDMREHLEKGLVSLHSLQQDVADLGRRMSAFEADASVQLPRMVPFDNTWSAYNAKASPSVDRKDIIDIADDSYVTMRKKHSSSTDDGD